MREEEEEEVEVECAERGFYMCLRVWRGVRERGARGLVVVWMWGRVCDGAGAQQLVRLLREARAPRREGAEELVCCLYGTLWDNPC